MPVRLRPEEVVTIKVLAEKGQPKTAIARQLGVTEGTVRYHLQRAAQGKTDGRKDRSFKAAEFREPIAAWFEAHEDDARPVNIRDLHEHLEAEHEYRYGYKALLRFVRAEYPRPKIRTYRRVETPPGAQTQTDWGEYPRVDVGDGPEPLSAFVMTLSHSRKPAVIWSRRHDQLSWLHCHNEAYRRLGGVAATNRIDNVKTAVVQGAGPWGTLHPTYVTYARSLGFHIDPCLPRQANAKGKAEAKVRLSRLRVDPGGRELDGLAHLQSWTDARIDAWTMRAICPATGKTVWDTWQEELESLRPLPELLPEPFDIAVTRPVDTDCMVAFEGRHYAVPFPYVGTRVEVRGCAGKVQIVAGTSIVREYPRHTAARLLIDPSCYEGEATERVLPPPPLGRMGRRLQELYETPVNQRPLDLYAALAEVAR